MIADVRMRISFLNFEGFEVDDAASANVFLAHDEAVEAGSFLEVYQHLLQPVLKPVLFVDEHMNF